MKTQTVRQCLDDFFKRHGKTSDFIEFAKIANNTEQSWRNAGKTPQGESLIRARHFLDLIGYQIDEIKLLSDSIYKVCQCVAFDIISIELLLKRCGLSKTSHLYNYLRGRSIPKIERLAILKKIANEHESARLLKYAENLELYKMYCVDFPKETSFSKENGLIADFRIVCEKVRHLGTKLLKGSVEQRFLMRDKMTTTQNPELHLTWEVLNSLLKEELK